MLVQPARDSWSRPGPRRRPSRTLAVERRASSSAAPPTWTRRCSAGSRRGSRAAPWHLGCWGAGMRSAPPAPAGAAGLRAGPRAPALRARGGAQGGGRRRVGGAGAPPPGRPMRAGHDRNPPAAPPRPVFDAGAGGIAAGGYLFIAFLACNTMWHLFCSLVGLPLWPRYGFASGTSASYSALSCPRAACGQADTLRSSRRTCPQNVRDVSASRRTRRPLTGPSGAPYLNTGARPPAGMPPWSTGLPSPSRYTSSSTSTRAHRSSVLYCLR